MTASMGCGGSTVVAPKASEINLVAGDGVQLAAQSWQVHPAEPSIRDQGEELRVLCLHGWMDNCRSFYWIAPALIEHLDSECPHPLEVTNDRYRHVHVVALDLPGHGLSSHRSTDAPPMVRSEYLFYIAEAIRKLAWWNPEEQKENTQQQPFVLIGHSMSAGLSLMYAAAFPEQVRQLILLDSLGHLSRPINTTSQNLRQYVLSRQLDGPMIQEPANRFYYPTLEAVVQARMRSPSMFPGKQYISERAARELVGRGVVEEEIHQPITTSCQPRYRFRFRHDPRLMWSSIQYFTEEQLEVLYRDVQCPTCILLGKDGWPFQEEQTQKVKELLKPSVFQTLPGSHHLHMDPGAADHVVREIVNFLSPP